MANKRQRKKAAKLAAPQMPKVTSRPKRDLRVGTVVNQHGVRIPQKKLRALEREVERINNISDTMRADLGKLEHFNEGRPTGATLNDMYRLGQDNEFIIARRTISLQRFKSEEQLDLAIEKFKGINAENYLEEKVRDYKRNYMTAIRHVYSWDESKDVLMKIRMMPVKEFMKFASQNDELSIDYIDSDGPTHGSLNGVRRALGMKPKDEDDSSEYYDDCEDW